MAFNRPSYVSLKIVSPPYRLSFRLLLGTTNLLYPLFKFYVCFISKKLSTKDDADLKMGAEMTLQTATL